jgi:hypothetical protein
MKAYAKIEIKLHACLSSARHNKDRPVPTQWEAPQSRAGRFVEEKNFVFILGIEIQTVSIVVRAVTGCSLYLNAA